MRKRTINLILAIICLTFIFLTLIPLFLGYYVGPRITRQILEQEVEKFFQKTVEVEGAGITIFGGFGIRYKNLRIRGPDGKEFFQAETFLLKPWIKSLMLGRLRWKRIVLKDPSVHLIRTSDGHINLDWKRREKSERKDEGFFHRLREMATHLPSQLSIRGGRIRFTDFGLTQDPLVTEIERIELTAHDISPEKPFSFRLTGRFVGGMGERFAISSKVTSKEEALDPSHLEFQISLKADSIDSRRIWPYVRSVLPVERMRGLLDLKIRFRGGATSFHSSGEMKIRQGHFAIPKLYTTAIEPKEASLNYDLEYDGEEIHISQVVFRLPHVSVRGKGSVQRIASRNRSISLEFTTGRASLKDISPDLPDRAIPEKLLPFLTDGGTQGFLRVEKARLEGSWANLSPEGLRKNPEMLSIRTRLDACSLLVDPKLPPIRNISGVLSLQGDKVEVSNFRGKFLRSHLSEINGSISRIHSSPRLAVTFKGDLDLKGLVSLLKSNRMPKEIREALEPIVKISGKAKMSGEIRHRFNNLTNLAYKGRISLRRGHVSLAGLALPLTNLEGEIRCDEKEILLSHFKWRMGESLWHGHASFRGYLRRLRKKVTLAKKLKISLDMGTEELRIDDLLSKRGRERKLQIDPRSIWVNSTINGKVRISRGSFNGARFENFDATFIVKRGLLRFKRFQAEVPGGFVRCRGWINLRSRRGVSFKLIPKIHQLDMANVIPIPLPQGKGTFISGTGNLDGIITGGGNSVDRITRSLAGDLRIRVENGTIHGLEALREDGLPYNHLTARVLIRRGVASTENSYLDSDVMSMVIRGQANLNDQSLDIHVGVRPLQTMDKILSNVPVVGWLLAGKDRSILTFSFQVSGKFNDLKVESPSARDGRPMNP